jgi:hypothetical protein
MKAGKEKIEAMRDTCLEKTEACLESKEWTSLGIESVAMHEEVPKEEATVIPVRSLKKRHGDRHVAVECCE